ncbi:NAD-dependent epimerase/dehydratase family protein [Mycobacterium sp.]|uniref:NAD-dependent epimerase/dehydratase family protein n=1 Tax=Mycobacterium sp. TaxID=1785 RepID=UPI0031D24A51
MRIVVTGASGVVGRGIVGRLLAAGHEVVGVARHRTESWPSAATFVPGDIRDAAVVRRAVVGADVVAHCAWADDPARHHVNVGGTATVLDAMATAGTRRIVFPSSAHVYGAHRAARPPVTEDDPLQPVSDEGRDKVRAEELLAACGAEWVALRCAVILGRDIDNRVRRLLASPFLPDGIAGRTLQVVHTDDVHRMFLRAILDTGMGSGPVNLAAPGEPTFAALAATLGRPTVPAANRRLAALLSAPTMDIARLQNDWRFTPSWRGEECVDDVALAVRGRVALGRRLVSLPWRLTHVQQVPAVDAPAPDGTVPRLAGPDGGNGEFDTPIDPRFPTFVATNLSEALPGPFSPSSASVAVRGLRAGGVTIAERLRPGGLIQREIATRTVGVFAHRLYGGITAGHFMAEAVPFVDPASVVADSQFFGPSVAALPVFGEHRLLRESRGLPRQLRTLRNAGVFGVNLVGLSVGCGSDTRRYVADVDRLERLAGDDTAALDDRRLLSLILLARDHVVHGWVLAAASFMLSAAYSVILRGLTGRQIAPPAGPDLISARPLAAVYRLAVAAQRDPDVVGLLAEPGQPLDVLAERAPAFHAAVLSELALIGHRGPAEVEMSSASYADNPDLLVAMVAKSLTAPARPQPHWPPIPPQARAVAALAARQLRDREERRDRMVRAIWLLRGLLREYGRRLAESGALARPDDVFYLLVDELDALPARVRDVVAGRRAERQRLRGVVPPPMFSGSWQPVTALAAVLTAGETLRGLGVCGGRVRGRVRVVRPETIDELEPGEVLVAVVTDVGYTVAFSHAAAVVTELGGPMSHAAVVAREFGIPCVVDAQGATRRLAPGALVEVDGGTGEIHLLTDAEISGGADEVENTVR